MDKRKVLVTSALPYANGPIHLGHLAGAYLPADIFARYCRLLGRDVIYICGTDEHGVPITLTADREGVSPQEVVDRWFVHIRDSFAGAGISFDHFSRTSLPVHHRTSQDFFLKIHEQGLLVKKTERQLYCARCARFLPDRYVEGTCHNCRTEGAKGDQCESCGKPIDPLLLIDPLCKLCGSVPEARETEHWYMPLDRFQPWLEEWFSRPDKQGWKENVLSFCRGYLAEGLKERAVTRDLDWGVPVPLSGTAGKVLYVWFDAPIGYISSTKEWAEQQGAPERWKDYWCDTENTRLVHFIGKDNIFFHALMFPAMLKAYNDNPSAEVQWVLPDNVPANEYLNLEGLKFSTSRNFAVWLADYLERFEPDPLRYYLCSNMPETRDTDFNLKEFQAHNNNELADTVGNFINRTLTFVERYFDGRVPERGVPDDLDREMLERLAAAGPAVGGCIDTFRFRAAADTFGEFARFCNKYFNDKAPWQSRKDDPAACASTLNLCVQACYALSVAMWPVMPFSAEKLWAQLGVPEDWRSHPWDQDFSAALPAGHSLGKVEVLFPKVEDSLIEAQSASLGKSRAGGTRREETQMETIDIGQFGKVDIRVALVRAAEEVPRSRSLIRLELDLGELGSRTVAAGIKGHYEPAELVGRKVLVAANLEPRKVMGIESQGMVLAAVHGESLSLCTLDSKFDLPPGTRIS
ncbi:MAG: methionine--tRNA ligase [Candidatus Glassbacteria bacterium]|nr:methionine--tRNA ligase [Candidatus Glassbacteria bacterium]